MYTYIIYTYIYIHIIYIYTHTIYIHTYIYIYIYVYIQRILVTHGGKSILNPVASLTAQVVDNNGTITEGKAQRRGFQGAFKPTTIYSADINNSYPLMI